MKELKELAMVLENNVELYEDLASKTLEEREAIEKCEFVKIARITEEKENIVFRIKQLEKKRSDLVLEISREMEKPGEITLKEIASHSKAATMSKALLSLSDKLKEIFSRVQEMNDFNKKILSSAVRTLRNAIMFSDNTSKPLLTYSGTRLNQQRVTPGSMLKKAM
ncbi:MAG: flagellar protein FlgN [Nitrospinota bacterium]|nr:flagellar protein FlgN [Nitrospinota bacterium]